MSEKLDIFNRTLTDWDEFRKWCEDRRGPSVVARDLALFVQLFRESQDRLRHTQLVSLLKSNAAAGGVSTDGQSAPRRSLDGERPLR